MADGAAEQGRATARELVDFEALGGDRFRARRNLGNHLGSTFGGQALGQALAAAQRTAPDWPAESLSGYFLRAGVVDQPIDFAVERVSDSRRFAVRRVQARQAGRPMFDMLCAFHDPEAGVAHQYAEAGRAPAPETLLNLQAFAAANAHRMPQRAVELYGRPFPVELKLLDPETVFFENPTAPARDFWFRMPSAQQIERPSDHLALLAMMSDYWLPAAAAAPHMLTGLARSIASLNHSLWFHRPVRVDEWLLYRTDSAWAAHGRGLARGLIYDRDGRLVATAMQEASMRPG